MKNRHLLSSILILLSVLLAFSCGGLTAPKSMQDTYTFTIDEDFIANLKRSGEGNNASTYRVSATLASVDSAISTYTHTEELTIDPSDPDANTTIQFTSIPLGIKLRLIVVGYVDDTPVLTSETKEFTLKTDRTKNISVQLFRERNTPYVLNTAQKNADDSLSGVYTMSLYSGEIDDETDISTLATRNMGDFGPDPAALDEMLIITYDFDSEGNLWYVDYMEDDGVTYQCLKFWHYDSTGYNIVISESTENLNLTIKAIRYDAQTDNLCFLLQQFGTSYYIAQMKPSDIIPNSENYKKGHFNDLFTSPQSLQILDMIQEPLCYADGGYFYLCNVQYDLNNNTQNIWKIDPSTGEYSVTADSNISSLTNEDGRVKNKLDFLEALSREGVDLNALKNAMLALNSEYYDKQFSLTVSDIAVYRDSVYLPFHLVMIFNSNDENGLKIGDYTTEGEPTELCFLDFGGIMVLSTADFSVKGFIGKPDLNTEISIPLYYEGTYEDLEVGDTGETDTVYATQYIYFENETQWTKDAYLPWCSACFENELRNPVKIVAIKPKKLIIADNGTFYIESDDKMKYYDGNIYSSPYNDLSIRSGADSRLVSVDLEDFSVTPLTTIGSYDEAEGTTTYSGYYETSQAQGFTLLLDPPDEWCTSEDAGSCFFHTKPLVYVDTVPEQGDEREYNEFRVDNNGVSVSHGCSENVRAKAKFGF